MKTELRKTLGIYFGPHVDIKVQVFNLLAIVGIMSGIIVAALAVIIKESVIISGIDLSIAVLSYFLLRVADKKKCYHLCSWIFIIVAFFILFPLLFFSCGGHKSGADYVFIIALVFTAILLVKHERIAALAGEFVLYFACILLCYYKPEMVVLLPSEFDYLFVNIINMTITCTIILIVVLICIRMFNNRHEQIEELNRELTARNETLAQYDTMKSDFLATVAHEINAPLAIISASSNDAMYLLNETPQKTDEINENLLLIKRRVKMIDGILLDLMDTVAIENGRISLTRQPASLYTHLKNICDVQFKLLDTNGNGITYEMDSVLPNVWVDLSRLEQVMINLLSNAVRHTKDGVITIKLTRENAKQIVGVIDNGEGMEPETAKTMLKQYVSTKADYWRHGIGLYICRRIITAHGGDIWIESEKGRGTSVFFSFMESAEYE